MLDLAEFDFTLSRDEKKKRYQDLLEISRKSWVRLDPNSLHVPDHFKNAARKHSKDKPNKVVHNPRLFLLNMSMIYQAME